MLINAFENDAPNSVLFDVARFVRQKSNWSVMICALRGKRFEDRAVRNHELDGINCVELCTDVNASIIKSVVILGDVVRQYKPDVTHVTLTRPAIISGLACLRVKIPNLIWTQNGIHEWSEHKYLPSSFFKFGLLALSRFVSNIVAVSSGVKLQLVASGFDEQKICCIYNGINTDLFSPQVSHSHEELRLKLGFQSDDVLIGAAGNLRKIKGHKWLISAFAEFQKHTQSASYLLIWGSGEEEQSLRKLVDVLNVQDSVLFLGYESHIENYLGGLDIFVQPSLSEAFGKAAAEALSLNVPVIASDVPGLSELIIPGRNGETVPIEDVDALAKMMLHVLDNRTEYTYCRDSILDRFSLNRMCKGYFELYERVSG